MWAPVLFGSLILSLGWIEGVPASAGDLTRLRSVRIQAIERLPELAKRAGELPPGDPLRPILEEYIELIPPSEQTYRQIVADSKHFFKHPVVPSDWEPAYHIYFSAMPPGDPHGLRADAVARLERVYLPRHPEFPEGSQARWVLGRLAEAEARLAYLMMTQRSAMKQLFPESLRLYPRAQIEICAGPCANRAGIGTRSEQMQDYEQRLELACNQELVRLGLVEQVLVHAGGCQSVCRYTTGKKGPVVSFVPADHAWSSTEMEMHLGVKTEDVPKEFAASATVQRLLETLPSTSICPDILEAKPSASPIPH